MTKMKKTIAILLTVLFLAAVTAGAVSAKVFNVKSSISTTATFNPAVLKQGAVNAEVSPKKLFKIDKKKGSDDTSQGTIIATAIKPRYSVETILATPRPIYPSNFMISSDDTSQRTITAKKQSIKPHLD